MATERYDKRIDRNEDHEYFQHYASYILPRTHGTVLDVGCGQGWLTKLMAKRDEVKSVTGLDKFTDQPEENQDDKITYSYEHIPFLSGVGNKCWDTIVSTEFIEHITQEDLEILLPQIHHALKDDGHFLGSTPNCDQPSGNPYHIREYSKEELKSLFAKHGFRGDIQNPTPSLTIWDVTK